MSLNQKLKKSLRLKIINPRFQNCKRKFYIRKKSLNNLSTTNYRETLSKMKTKPWARSSKSMFKKSVLCGKSGSITVNKPINSNNTRTLWFKILL
jgi:hypothetical protein